MFCREFLDFGFIHQTISRLSSETLRFLKGKQPSKTNSFILYLSKPWHISKISLLKCGDKRFLSGVNGVERKMTENLAVRRKNRQISTKSRKKLTVKNFLFIAAERNSALAVKCPKFQTMTVKARPIETLLRLVTIWRSSDFFIVQINILFFTA